MNVFSIYFLLFNEVHKPQVGYFDMLNFNLNSQTRMCHDTTSDIKKLYF